MKVVTSFSWPAIHTVPSLHPSADFLLLFFIFLLTLFLYYSPFFLFSPVAVPPVVPPMPPVVTLLQHLEVWSLVLLGVSSHWEVFFYCMGPS